MKKYLISLGAIIALAATFSSPSASAAFNPGLIIDDNIFTNSSSMSTQQIQSFLNSKVPACDTWGTQPSEYGGGTRAQYAASRGWQAPPYVCLRDYTQNGESAAEIILNVSKKYQINPQVLLVLLQKEQGLVTDIWPLNSQYKTATGYGCPDTAPCDSQYFGLTNQLDWAAKMFRSILNASPTWYTPYVLGNNYIQYNPDKACGGSVVNIQNRSTQALYNYTPYQPNSGALNAGWGTAPCGAYGNRNFYLYFTNWFGATTGPNFAWSAISQKISVDNTFSTKVSDANNSVKMTYGQKLHVQIKAVNKGSQTWYSNTIKLATSAPIDRSSPFASGSGWLSSNRTTWLKETSVAPGQIGTFEFQITAPSTAGRYQEYFRLVHDGAAWFNDIGLYFIINVAPPVTTENNTSILKTGRILATNESLKSNNGKYTLISQSDGNLVLYSPQGAIWASKTAGTGSANLSAQDDGNLVLYASGKAVWASKTAGAGSANLSAQDDGNLVLYASGKAVWASKTAGL